MPMSGGGGLGRNTIGRKETLRMTEYNHHTSCTSTSARPRLSERREISQQDSEGWRSAKAGKRTRRRYSESEEYDSDTDSERQDCILWSQHRAGERRGKVQPLASSYQLPTGIYNSPLLGTNHPEQNLQTSLTRNDFILSDIEPSSIFEMTFYPHLNSTTAN